MGANDANVGYVMIGADGSVEAADDVFLRWVAGRSFTDLLPDFSADDALGAICRGIKFCPADVEPSQADVTSRRLQGTHGGSLLLRIERVADATDMVEYRDPVTGLPDRRALASYRRTLLERADGAAPHAVLFLDLDNFKQINDSLGHAVGDQVLAILAERWRKSLRGRDLIVRYGGDEFVALLAGVRTDADIQPIVERLHAVTVGPIKIGGYTMEVSVAIGVARAEDGTTSLDELLNSADRAMYLAKRQG